MFLLTRYIIKEHIGPFFFGLLTIVFIFLLNIAFRDLGRLLGKGLGFGIIIEFFILNLAWIVALAVPMAVLISTLMAFGRLSSDNEITALKAGGIHFYRLIAPIFIISIFIAIGMERFNNIILPDFNHRVRLLYSDISRKRPTLTLEPHVFFNEFDQYSLIVREVDGDNKLKGIIINDYSDPRFNKTIFADHGEVSFSREQERIVFRLYDGEIHEVEVEDLQNYRRLRFAEQRLSIPFKNMELKRSNTEHRGDREKSAEMMREDIRKNMIAIQERTDRIQTLVEGRLSEILPETLWSEKDSSASDMKNFPGRRDAETRVNALLKQVEVENRVIEGYRRSNSSKYVEIQKKYSIPVACMVFVLIGAPLGILARQGGMALGGVLSLVFYLIYWSFLIGGEQLADRQYLNPVIAMWAPNVLVGIVGIYLVIRTVREMPFIDGLFSREKKRASSGAGEEQ